MRINIIALLLLFDLTLILISRLLTWDEIVKDDEGNQVDRVQRPNYLIVFFAGIFLLVPTFGILVTGIDKAPIVSITENYSVSNITTSTITETPQADTSWNTKYFGLTLLVMSIFTIVYGGLGYIVYQLKKAL